MMHPSPDAAISGRDRITRAIEACGVVAVIRLKEPDKLRGVVDALAEGGVTVDNAGDWIRAGAVAVGVGSALLDAKSISSGSYAPIADNARRIVANVRAARARS
jgi:2-keto-3-deoxy-6-phosphogluconate aldolase